MIFLNIILLGGAAAITIPIIVHLINRNRHKIVPWGAMHLLEATLREQRRRMRLENILLMILRCLIPLCLAFCMARPALVGANLPWHGTQKTSLVVLLDNSYSLEYKGAGDSNFQQAREAAAQLVANLKRGSDVSVVLMSGTNEPLYRSRMLTDSVARDLRKLEAGFGKAEVALAMELAAQSANTSKQPHREVVIITDFQQVSWGEDDAPMRQRAAELVRNVSPKLPPKITLFHVGAEGRENICVETVELSRLLLGVKQNFTVRATLRNFGQEDREALHVQFRVDGKNKADTRIELPAGEQRQVLFTHTFDKPGSHVVEVATDADNLKADNTYAVSVPVWDRVPVLVLDGAPGSGVLDAETSFLRIALMPFGEAKAKLADLIQGRILPATDFTARDLNDVRVVILANVARLNAAQLNALRDFVQAGGGLLMFSGDKLDLGWHRTTFNSYQILPGVPTAEARAPAAGFARINAQQHARPPLDLFNDPRNGVLADAEIQRWHRLDAPDNPLTTILAQLDNGDPFLVEKQFGEGRILQCATACDADWSNLPGRSFYVPFIQRMVTYLAVTSLPPRNLMAGAPLVAHYPEENVGRDATLVDSSGKRHKLPLTKRGGKAVVEYRATQRPGTYLLTGPDQQPRHFVVTTSRLESDLTQVTPAGREKIAQAMGADLVDNVGDYRQLDHTRRHGQEIWKILFLLLLLFLFGEMILRQRMSRARK